MVTVAVAVVVGGCNGWVIEKKLAALSGSGRVVVVAWVVVVVVVDVYSGGGDK